MLFNKNICSIFFLFVIFTNNSNADDHSDLFFIASIINKKHIFHPQLSEIPINSINNLNHYLENLDPYSKYFNSQDFSKISGVAHVEKKGIGAAVTKNQEDGLILIPFESGSAYNAGIRQPVKLISVENQNISQISELENIIGSHSKIAVNTKNLISGRIQEFVIFIAPFEVPSVEIVDVKGKKILRVHIFQEKKTFLLLRQILKTLTNSDEPLIIDLRYAVGGDLFEAIDAVSLIIPLRLPVASVITADGLSVTYQNRTNLCMVHQPVYLLIGSNTASAAEVFARALHYYGYATLVGMPSFGKCLAQQFIELPNKDGLKLTVGKILDPAGNYCEGNGIYPNVYFKNIFDTEKLLELITRHDEGNFDSIPHNK